MRRQTLIQATPGWHSQGLHLPEVTTACVQAQRNACNAQRTSHRIRQREHDEILSGSQDESRHGDHRQRYEKDSELEQARTPQHYPFVRHAHKECGC